MGSSLTEGVQQAKDYAQRMHVRFTYSSNGQGFWEIDMLTGEEKELGISEFPTPEELWERTYESEDEWRDKFSEVPFEDRGGTWAPRYYQDNAVEAALKAIGDGNDRILLTLATGTGKTSIAFQIAWKLFQTRWNRSEGIFSSSSYSFPCRSKHLGESSLQFVFCIWRTCNGANYSCRYS